MKRRVGKVGHAEVRKYLQRLMKRFNYRGIGDHRASRSGEQETLIFVLSIFKVVSKPSQCGYISL